MWARRLQSFVIFEWKIAKSYGSCWDFPFMGGVVDGTGINASRPVGPERLGNGEL